MNDKPCDQILENMASRILRLERRLYRLELINDDIDERVVRHNENIDDLFEMVTEIVDPGERD